MKNIVLIASIALLIGGMGGYLIADKDDDGMKGMDHSMMQHDDTDSDRMPMGNMGGMDHSAMMVASEQDFLIGMIPHHQEAVDTAREVVERGGSTPEIQALAENIILAQETEISDMKAWYQAWYGEAYASEAGDYQPMMRELSGLSGAEIDKRFLEDMVMHHRGAIMMAQSVQEYIEHQEIADLSEAIILTQTEEIKVMKRLRSELE